VAREDQNAFAVWITGLPSSGKSTVTAALVRKVRALGVEVVVLESDALRKMFSTHSTYDERERDFFYTSLAFIGEVLTGQGLSVIFDATANLRAYRDRARQAIPRFVEVFVDCPLEVCIGRDPKGIYRLAREGKANHVPGLQAEYEPPLKPDLVVRGDREDPEQAASRIVDFLASRRFLTLPQPGAN
jgi:adenylylsulfate kinase